MRIVKRSDGNAESRHSLLADRQRTRHSLQSRAHFVVARHDELPQLQPFKGRNGRAHEGGEGDFSLHDLHRLSLLRHAGALPGLGIGNYFLQSKDVDASFTHVLLQHNRRHRKFKKIKIYEKIFLIRRSFQGKVLAAVPYAWSRRQLILMSSLRALLIPLLLLCVAPRKNPTISGELPAFIFTAALGLSNGLAGSLPMLLAPQKVAAPLKEMAGNIMTISYMTGLTAGSLVGYVFENMLGPPIAFPCLQYPYVPKKPDEIETTTAMIQTTTTQLVPTFISLFTSTLSPLTTEMSTEITTMASFMNSSSTGFIVSNSTLLNET